MRLLYLLYHIVVILSRGEIIENENFRDDKVYAEKISGVVWNNLYLRI